MTCQIESYSKLEPGSVPKSKKTRLTLSVHLTSKPSRWKVWKHPNSTIRLKCSVWHHDTLGDNWSLRQATNNWLSCTRCHESGEWVRPNSLSLKASPIIESLRPAGCRDRTNVPQGSQLDACPLHYCTRRYLSPPPFHLPSPSRAISIDTCGSHPFHGRVQMRLFV